MNFAEMLADMRAAADYLVSPRVGMLGWTKARECLVRCATALVTAAQLEASCPDKCPCCGLFLPVPDKDMMDQSRLDYENGDYQSSEEFLRDAEFAALARNAYAVMMRRKFSTCYHIDKQTWYAEKPEGWAVRTEDGRRFESADPFTCLVEADAYFTGIGK